MNKYQKQTATFYEKYKELQVKLMNKKLHRLDLITDNKFLELENNDIQIKLSELKKVLSNIDESKAEIEFVKSKQSEANIINAMILLMDIASIITIAISGINTMTSKIVISLLSAFLVLFPTIEYLIYNKKTSPHKHYLKRHNEELTNLEHEKTLELSNQLQAKLSVNQDKLHSLNQEIEKLENLSAQFLGCKKQMVIAEQQASEKLGPDAYSNDYDKHYKKDSRVNTIMRRSRKK